MDELKTRADSMRADIIASICKAGSGHPGGSLSCADIMCALYFGGVLRHDPKNLDDPSRDRFILAKGHAAPALYAVLAHSGYFDREELLTLRHPKSRLQGHPDSNLLPGVEVSTGSLGQGLSISCGIACGLRLQENSAHVFTLLGDGECEEGQVWEAAMFAANQGLDNLCAIIDANGLQIDGHVNDVAGLGDLDKKFEAFGWETRFVDGHDIDMLISVLADVRQSRGGKPVCVIANTTKGKGVSFMENQAGWHGKAPSVDEARVAIDELGCPCVGDYANVEAGE